MRKGEHVGTIVQVQVQRVPLKEKGVGYSPDPILVTDKAMVDSAGMLAWENGSWIIDTHHRSHPTRRGGGRRTLSVGFTGHYDEMRKRFGDVELGVAGENMIIDAGPLSLDDLGDGLLVETAEGETIELGNPRIAVACVEFTSFMLGRDDVAQLDDVREDYDSLQEGRRGFLVDAGNDAKAIAVAPGDEVYFAVAD